MTPREVHERTARLVFDCLCRYLRWRTETLCMDPMDAAGSLSCTRPRGHAGPHVACAGVEGPHASASWSRASQGDPEEWIRRTEAEGPDPGGTGEGSPHRCGREAPGGLKRLD